MLLLGMIYCEIKTLNYIVLYGELNLRVVLPFWQNLLALKLEYFLESLVLTAAINYTA